MAKKKASNPVDAARKAARARELKKNKAEREKVREVVTVRKDTKGLEADIRRLESKERAGNLTKSDKSDLTDLKAELSRITEAKEAYVAAHPEHRKYVYGKESQQGGDETVFGDGKKKSISNLSGSNALSGSGSGSGNGGIGTGMGYQRDPKRSVYYHEIFNPLGAPPPGMPYLEKPPDQWDPPFGIPTYTGPPPSLDPMTTTAEASSSSASTSNQQISVEDQGDNEGEENEDEDDEDEDEDEDEEISLPSGPAPPLPDLPSLPEEDPIGKDQDQDLDSDSDIVMPEGPPPPREEEEGSDFQPPLPPIPTGPKSNHQSAPPPPPPLPSGPPPSKNFNQPPPPIFYSGPPPPLPPSNLYSHPPPPLPLPNQFGHPPPPPGYGHPPNVKGNFNHRGGGFDGRGRGFDRGRGRGRGNFLPQDRRNPQFQQEVLDPLSADGKSHETFASHASKMREKSRSETTGGQGQDPSSSTSGSGLNSLPSKPTSTPGGAGTSKPSTGSATISAEPQLRDLKKEVIAFLPPAMRRKLQKEKERKEMGLPDLNKLTSAPREEDQSGSGNGYGSNNNDGGSGYLEGWDDDDRQGNRNDTSSTNPKARGEFQTFEKPNLLNALKSQLNDPSKMGSRINIGSTSGSGSGKSTREGNKKRKNDDYDKFLNEMGDLL